MTAAPCRPAVHKQITTERQGSSMTIQKIWLSPASSKKSLYAGRTVGGILGIVALMMLLIFGGVFLTSFAGLPRELFSLVLCLGVTALGVVLGLRLGRRTLHDATVFLLTSENRLYGLLASDFARSGGRPLSYMAGTLETQRFLRELAASPFLPAAADEILRVESIRETGSEYVVRCQVRREDHPSFSRTYFVAKDLKDADQLLGQLERRQGWENTLEPVQNNNPLGMLVSGGAMAVFAVMCVLSHPAQAKLPQEIYFPSLGAAFAAFCVLVWFVVRQHRGE